MGIFANWIKNRTLSEDNGEIGSPVDKFRFNNDGPDIDHPQDYEKVRMELFKLTFDKYPDETMRFFHEIAQRGDDEIKTLLNQLGAQKKSRSFRDPPHSTSQDEVVPSKADAAHGGEGGGS